MTPRELIDAGSCTPRCLLAGAVQKCRCACRGVHHGLLLHVHLDGLIDGRHRGLHRVGDAEIVAAAW